MSLRLADRLNSVDRFRGSTLTCSTHALGQGRLGDGAQKALRLDLGRGSRSQLTEGNGPDGLPFLVQRSLAEAAVVFGQPAQGLGGKPRAQIFLGLPERGQFWIKRVKRGGRRRCALGDRRSV